MSKIDLSTQAKRWKYVAAGGALRSGGVRVTFSEGQLRFFNRDGEVNPELFPQTVALLAYDEWDAHQFPIKVDTIWEFYLNSGTGIVYPVMFDRPDVFDIKSLLGKRFKVSLEEITE